uniref:Uncharacterized protein n=1 Tax=Anguilla anguilla TaxID=7936 RepID=A0A0E9VT79_ANGAN
MCIFSGLVKCVWSNSKPPWVSYILNLQFHFPEKILRTLLKLSRPALRSRSRGSPVPA